MKQLALLLALILTVGAFAQTEREVSTSVLNVKEQSSAPSSPAAGKAKLYYRNGKLRVKNSAGLEAAVGSGPSSTSGVNLASNESFEDGVSSGYTSSGGTFSQQTYTNGTDADGKYARFISTVIGDYFETSAVAVTDSLGAGCMADIDLLVTSGSWTVTARDGSNNVLSTATVAAPNATSWFKLPTVAFACPSAGTTIKLRVTSTATGTINADHVYVGGNKNISQVAQARLAGSSYIAATGGCTLSRTNTAYGAPTTAASCPGPTVSSSYIGSWQTTDADTASFTINSLPPGRYVGVMRMAMINGTSNAVVCGRVTDGTTSGLGVCHSSAATTDAMFIAPQVEVNYVEPGNRTFSIQTKASSGAVSVANSTDYAGIEFTLYYYPTDQQSAISPDQSGWFIDANIGGNDASLGTSAVSSYTGLENSSLDMVLRTGSATAQIGCSSTNSPSGLTCASGSESISVAWTPPYTGFFDVCFHFSHRVVTGASGQVVAAFQVVETATNAQTVTAEGGERIQSAASANADMAFPHRVCGAFYVSSTTQKMHRLMYEQLAAATISSNVVQADRQASAGQRDVRVTVRPSTMNIARPVLTGDQVTTPGATSAKHYSGKVSSTGAISDAKGAGLFSSCTNANPRVCTLATSKTLNCQCTSVLNGAGSGTSCAIDDQTTALISFKTFNNNTANQHAFNYSCDE